jgi:anaerobic magnesium-protoporphyrin IX monomethyl ester cyclase
MQRSRQKYGIKGDYMIVLVNIVSELRNVADKTRPPSGILFVGGSLKSAGHDVKLLHIYEHEIDAAVEQIRQLKPLYVGFSVFTGYPCYTASVMSKKIKQVMPGIPVVWGGIHPSIDTEKCLQEDYIDFVVVGEGEETIRELTSRIMDGKGYEDVKGIGYKHNGLIKINPRRELIKDLDNFQMDWSLVDPRDYVRPSSDGQKSICYITSRGCPFHCGFCYNELFNMRKYRMFSIDHVVKHIKALRDATGITRISFDDDHFMVDVKRGFEILTRLKEFGVHCDFLPLRLESVTRETMKKLLELGVKRIFFGWESGSNRILKLICKEFTKEFILEKMRIVAEFPQITVSASGIIGFPTETLDEIRETIDVAIKMSDILPDIVTNLGTYMPYPGTTMYALSMAEGFRPPERIEDWKDFDLLGGKTEPTWISWADSSTKRKLFLIDKYAYYITRPVKFAKGRNIVKYLGRLAFYYISRFRLRHMLFIFPVEVYFHVWWIKWSMSKSLKNFK